MARPAVDALAVEAEVASIETMTKPAMREMWRAMFKADPPKAFGPDLLRRSLAYKVQEKAFGGLSARTRRELDAVIKQLAKNPTGHIDLPRRIKSGAVLIREWKGKVVRVTVVDNGFLYEGKTYASLSEVAGLITGTNWNGPRFFGLRPSKRAVTAEPEPVAPMRRGRGRPRKPKPHTTQQADSPRAGVGS